MKLVTYLKRNKISQNKFAQKSKVPQTLINLYCNGEISPSLKNAEKIVKATKGQVQIKDLLVTKIVKEGA